jgi:acyl carrier protein
MSNRTIYESAFIELFQVEKEILATGLEYQGVLAWDSVGHMELIAKLESDFDIMMEMDDVIDFSSFQKGIDILKKYEIVIE